jgi:hypothetical protein
MVNGLITLLPLIWQDSPYYTPLSNSAWFLYASIQYVPFKILDSLIEVLIRTSDKYRLHSIYQTRKRCLDLRDCYCGWMLDVERVAKKTASEQSWEMTSAS